MGISPDLLSAIWQKVITDSSVTEEQLSLQSEEEAVKVQVRRQGKSESLMMVVKPVGERLYHSNHFSGFSLGNGLFVMWDEAIPTSCLQQLLQTG